jgi:hypothetical protein
VSNDKKRTAEEIADELAAIAVEHLERLSPEDSEARIVALEKRAASISSRKRVAAGSRASSSDCTRPSPVYARGRGRS